MANTIKIKRGLSSGLSSLTLQEGEPAITTDTKKLYIGNSDGSKIEIGQQGPRGTKWWVGDFYSEMFTDALDGDLLLNTSDISPGEVLQFYDGTWNPVANIRGPQGEKGEKGNPGDMAPVGSIYLWGSNTIPEGYLLCNGQAISRTEYSDLFAILGTSYGSGDGSSTFNLPDYRDKFALGAGGDVDLAEIGGEKEVTLTIDEMPAHTHPVKDRVYNVQFGRNDGGNGSRNPIGGTGLSHGVVEASSVGGGQAHNNMPPFIAMNFIIKAIPTQVVEGQVINSMESNSEVDAPSIKAVNDVIKKSALTVRANVNRTYTKNTVYQTVDAYNEIVGQVGNNIEMVSNGVFKVKKDIGVSLSFYNNIQPYTTKQLIMYRITVNDTDVYSQSGFECGDQWGNSGQSMAPYVLDLKQNDTVSIKLYTDINSCTVRASSYISLIEL